MACIGGGIASGGCRIPDSSTKATEVGEKGAKKNSRYLSHTSTHLPLFTAVRQPLPSVVYEATIVIRSLSTKLWISKTK